MLGCGEACPLVKPRRPLSKRKTLKKFLAHPQEIVHLAHMLLTRLIGDLTTLQGHDRWRLTNQARIRTNSHHWLSLASYWLLAGQHAHSFRFFSNNAMNKQKSRPVDDSFLIKLI